MKKIGEKITKPVILSSIFGLLAAMVGTFAIISFYMPGGIFEKNIDTENQTQELLKTSLGIKAYGRLEVFEFLDKALPSVAGIYKKKTATTLIDSLYLEKDRLGFGFVLTSDGWIVTDASAIDGWSVKALTVSIGNVLYNVEDKVNDAWTDVVFLKLDAKKLPVISLGDSEAVQLGDVVFSGSGKNNFWFNYVNAINFYPNKTSKGELLLSSEEFGKVIKLQGDIPIELDGGMMANRFGEVIGIAVAGKNQNYIIPINYFKGVVNSVLKDRRVERPYLGVNYIDLSFALGSDLPNESGAYVYGGGLLRSVEAGSPAAQAGLSTGDTILAVENTNINEYKNLSEIIYEYKPGDEITLKILREGEEREIKAKLGSK
ncbi:S1C family serine protease [Candidatus Parcubacteria bacterium]|nr:S1C family serine protease [Patescibacteria group bacterium]MCG2694080.1 S1C family serine protease [Candidatus Parcubacteria bacterium]